MKTLFGAIVLFLIMHACNVAVAQTFTPPKNLPVKPVPQTPIKFSLSKPDLQIVAVHVIGVTNLSTPNTVQIRLSVTYKNAGNAPTRTNFNMQLLAFRAGSDNGSTSISSYVLQNYTNELPLNAGQSRTEEWSFTKDKTYFSSGTHQCMVLIDYDNKIEETDETNNKSALFQITIP